MKALLWFVVACGGGGNTPDAVIEISDTPRVDAPVVAFDAPADAAIVDALTGTGLTFSPSPIVVSAQVGTNHQGGVTISNPSPTSIASPMSVDGDSAFSFGDTNCANPIAPGGVCTALFYFDPVMEGTVDGALHVGTYAVAIHGTGEAAPFELMPTPAAVALGNLNLGATAMQAIVIKNLGATTSPALTEGLTQGSSDWSISDDTCTNAQLAPGATCGVTVHFASSQAGSSIADLGLGAATFGVNIKLTATVLVPTFTPKQHAFGGIAIGASSPPYTFTIGNPSATDPMTLGLALTGANPDQFAIDATTCPAVLAAGSTCTVTTHFAPTSAGQKFCSVAADGASALMTGTGN